MSYIPLLNDLVSLANQAFKTKWSLAQRVLELEFQVHTRHKSLQDSLGYSFSLQIQDLFKPRRPILLLRLFSNSPSPLFQSQNPEEKQSDSLILMEKYPQLKLLLTTFCEDHQQLLASLLTRRDFDSSDISIIQEVFLSKKTLHFLNQKSSRGNFVLALFECDDPFNFPFVIEMIKLWSVFNGHILFRIRHLPIKAFESLVSNPENKKENEIFSNPLLRLPVNLHTELFLQTNLDQELYNTETCYYESEEYFMNLQSEEENVTSFVSEFCIEEETASIDQLQVFPGVAFSLVSGLHKSESAHKLTFGNIVLMVYVNNIPLATMGTDSIENDINSEINFLFERELQEIYLKQWKLKVSSCHEPNFRKRKTIANLFEIRTRIQQEMTFQIIILFNLCFEKTMFGSDPLGTILQIIQQEARTISAEIREILSRKLETIMDVLCDNEIYLTKKLRNSNKIPEFYIPKLVNSLSNILLKFQDLVVSDALELGSEKLKQTVRKTGNDERKLKEVLKQNLYRSILQNKLGK